MNAGRTGNRLVWCGVPLLVVFLLAGCFSRSVTPVGREVPKGEPVSSEALALWKRTVGAAKSVPLQARVTITRYTPNQTSVFDYIEGMGGRQYRSHYLAPKWVKGRTIVSDGKTIWHYEPRSRVVFHRAVQWGTDNELSLPEECQPQIESHNALVDGRKTDVLVLHSASGRVIERWWIDQEMGRVIRTEEYSGVNSHLMRRVELANITFLPLVTATTFTPSFFPPGTRMLTARLEKATDSRETVAAAKRVRLPARAHGFALRSVRHGRVLGSAPSSPSTVYLFYSNGAQEVSVAVTPSATRNGKSVDAKDVRQAPDWKAVSLGKKQIAFAQERSQGRTAVTWYEPQHRYIAVSHLALLDLLPVAEALANDDDAPETQSEKNLEK